MLRELNEAEMMMVSGGGSPAENPERNPMLEPEIEMPGAHQTYRPDPIAAAISDAMENGTLSGFLFDSDGGDNPTNVTEMSILQAICFGLNMGGGNDSVIGDPVDHADRACGTNVGGNNN